MSEPHKPDKGDHPLLSLVFNIAAPVLVLKKLSEPLGPGIALLVALAFPIGYGAWDFWKRRKTNAISILGFLNTLLTGGLAWVGLGGFWFAVKEAAFPCLVGLFVLGSAWTKRPAVETLFLNPSLFDLDKLNTRIRENAAEAAFHRLLKNSTLWLSLSFFLSAVFNFALASKILLPMDGMDETARQTLLNDQIAQMTQWSLLVILVPSMAFLMAIMYRLIRSIKTLTGLTDDELLKMK